MSANTSGLSANTYTGQIAITVTNQATGAALTSVNIPVTLYVSTNALLLVTPAAAGGVYRPGLQRPVVAAPELLHSPAPATDQLTLSVGQPQTDSGGQWLLVSAAPASTPGTLQLIAVPPASLQPGTYTGSVTVTATGPAGAVLDSPVTIPVVLQLTSGTISVTPAPASRSHRALAGRPRPRRRSPYPATCLG